MTFSDNYLDTYRRTDGVFDEVIVDLDLTVIDPLGEAFPMGE